MKVLEHISDEHEDVIKVRLRGSSSTVNALRRVIFREIPTLAVTNVIIHKNTSIQHDQYLADRIKQIVVKSVHNVEDGAEVVDCEPSKYKVILTHNPKKDIKEIRARDVIGDAAAFPRAVLVKLKNVEGLKVTVETGWGTGKTHSKFFPATTVNFVLVEGSEADGVYHLTIESAGGMPAVVILQKAINVISRKIQRLQQKIPEDEPEDDEGETVAGM